MRIGGRFLTHTQATLEKKLGLEKGAMGDRKENARVWREFAAERVADLTNNPSGLSTVTSAEPTMQEASIQRHEVSIPPEVQRYVLSSSIIVNPSECIGEGGQGKVYKGTYQSSPVAVKIVERTPNSFQDAMNEVILTKKLRHQNIIEVIGFYLNPDQICIVMELAQHSLQSYITKKNGPLHLSETLQFSFQIANALDYCLKLQDQEPIHHCDLKTENILIANGKVRIADFGVALSCKQTGLTTRSSQTKDGRGYVRGTWIWQGPEISTICCRSSHPGNNLGHRGEKSDVYSFGLIMWSMATGNYPYDQHANSQEKENRNLAYEGERPILPSSHPPYIRSFVTSSELVGDKTTNYALDFQTLQPFYPCALAQRWTYLENRTCINLLPLLFLP